MRINAGDFHMLATGGGAEQLFRRTPVLADAVHAGVDLQMHTPALPRALGGFVDGLDLEHGTGRHVEVVFQKQRNLRTDDAAQNEDRLRQSRAAQRDSLFHEAHAKVVCVEVGKDPRTREQAVAVGVGFDHCHDLHARRVPLKGAEIGGDGGAVDARERRAMQFTRIGGNHVREADGITTH